MRDFFKTTLATLLGLTLFTGVSIFGLLTLLVIIGSQDGKPEVQNQSILTVDLARSITDSEPQQTAREVVNDLISGDFSESLTLRKVTTAIDQAAQDPRILAIYLRSNSTAANNPSGYAILKEVRDALVRFKGSGKKIYAYDTQWREKEYYLGSVADSIAINPMGAMEFNGLSSQTMFYTQALEKFGIGVQAIWRGKYKSAIEPYVRKSSSPASKEQTQKLLGDIWSDVLTTTGKARQIPVETLQKLADTKGILTPKDAQSAKLVDRIAYPDEIQEELKKLTGEDQKTKSFRNISLQSYAEAVSAKVNTEKGGKVAVVYAEGSIVDGLGGPDMIGGDSLAKEIRKLRQDPEVKAIVLRINSPGGSAIASDIIQREVILAKKAKPLVVSMGTVAASGGYWIATYSDRIFAEPNTITGSIGVFGILPNIQKIANENGITWDVVKTGKFADAETLSRPKTKEEIAIVQQVIGQIYDQFLDKVSESRKLDRSKVGEIAQGRVWSGTEAQKIGLVDEMGGLDAAIQDAAKRAKLGDNWHVEEYPKPGTFEERLFQNLLGAHLKSNPPQNDAFSQEFKKLKADFGQLKTLNDPRGVYLRMPESYLFE
jgi:protease IV